ncbi:MAG: uroporphyrinogen decarboxylase [Rhodospirillales bacterium]|nr:uroporphyrinogen decarboxylase [Rhodospirillales bacterium]MCW9039285.1 uroporphyrinogen decarboxylase [Rhodospirillales bacterium]
MSENVKNKRFLQALQGKTVTPPPFWLMRQAGRYLPEYREIRSTSRNFLEFCYTPDLAVEVTLQPLRRYGFDAAILFSDILVIPDALGQGVAFKEGEGPVLEPIRTVDELGQLDVDRVINHLSPVFETVSRLRKEIPETTALIGFAGAPWTVATYMVEGRGGTDYGRVKNWAYNAPDEFGRLIDTVVEATVRYLIEQVRHGAETLQIFDTWAGVLSESGFRRWVIEPTATIVSRVKEACPGIPVIGFPRGAGALYVDYVRETGVDGVSLDTAVPLKWAAENLQPLCTVQGNLDNQILVAGGAAMESEITRILDTLGRGPFIFNLGHGIVPHTPPEHVARLAELVKGWKG